MTELSSPVEIMVARDRARPLLQRIMEKYRRRRDARLLAKLDDHMLRDIGLTRYDVELLARS
jgi:uncharacterized protein YjiS (DUF1127 family)